MAKYTFDEKKTQQYLESRPRKSLAVKVIIRSDLGTILLVKPNYKNGWQFPGGGVEALEDPKDAAVREVAEEIGLTIRTNELKLLDIVFREERDELIIMYEYSQPVSSTQTLEIQEDELDDFEYTRPEDVLSKIGAYYSHFWSSYLSRSNS